MKDLKRASARGVAWNLIQNVVSRLLALIVVGILSRILDRDAFGGVALSLAVIHFVELFVNQGYGEFVTQSRALTEEHLDTAFWLNLAMGVVFTLVLALCAAPLASAFDAPEVAPVIRLLSLSLIFRSLAVVPTGLLVREMQFRSVSMRTVVAAVAGGTTGIVAAYQGLGIYSLVIQLLVGDLAATLMLWHATAWRPGRRFDVGLVSELWAFGTPIIGAALLGSVSRRLDTLFVGTVLGIAALGLYSMAQRVFQIMMHVLNKSTTDVTFSALSRLADSEDQRRNAYYRAIEITAVVCFPVYTGMAVVAEPLTVVLFGAHWADSAPVLAVFSLSGVPFSLSLMHIAAFKSTGKTRLIMWSNLAQLVVFVPAILALVEGGPARASLASLLTCALTIPLELWFLRIAMAVRAADYVRSLSGATLATLAMISATYWLVDATEPLVPIAQLLAVATCGAAVYIITLRIVAPVSFKRALGLANTITRRGTT